MSIKISASTTLNTIAKISSTTNVFLNFFFTALNIPNTIANITNTTVAIFNAINNMYKTTKIITIGITTKLAIYNSPLLLFSSTIYHKKENYSTRFYIYNNFLHLLYLIFF